MAVTLSGMTLHTDNDTQQNWAGTDDLDDYNNAVQGINSEAWLVAKNGTETGTLTKSSTLPTTRGLFIFWMSSNLAPYYTDISLELESTTNNHKTFEVANSTNKAIGGDFVASAVDYVNKGTETGTFAPASFSALSIIVDNSASGNIRSVINNWIDAMYYGVGHTVTGTTTTDKLFNEIAAVDELTANKYGVVWNYKGGIYSQGDITLNGTDLVSYGETLFFVDTLNGYDTYNLNGTGTVEFENTSVVAAGTIAVNITTTNMTSFSMKGGALSGLGSTYLANGITFSGVVMTGRGLTSTFADLVSCTWNACGNISVATAGSLDKCVINQSSATNAVTVSSLDNLTACTFISDGTGHAVALDPVSVDTSMAWDCNDSGYAATSGSTGNETIVVSVAATKTLTINVSATATSPTVYNSGSGDVDIVVGQKTLTFTDLPSGVEVRITQGSYTIQYTGNVLTGTDSYVYTYAGDTKVKISVGGSGYVRETIDYVLKNADASLSFPLKPDPSYIS